MVKVQDQSPALTSWFCHRLLHISRANKDLHYHFRQGLVLGFICTNPLLKVPRSWEGSLCIHTVPIKHKGVKTAVMLHIATAQSTLKEGNINQIKVFAEKNLSHAIPLDFQINNNPSETMFEVPLDEQPARISHPERRPFSHTCKGLPFGRKEEMRGEEGKQQSLEMTRYSEKGIIDETTNYAE